jgi:hypothetical protein
MAEHCEKCGLVYSRHLQMRPEIAKVQGLALGHFNGFSSMLDTKGRLTYCPPVLSPGNGATTPTDGLQVYAVVDLRQEAIDSATEAHREMLERVGEHYDPGPEITPGSPLDQWAKEAVLSDEILLFTREQADHILNTCYPRFAVGPLSTAAAIEAARQIAKAVDEARGMA